jgi:hypothetical protein
MSTTGMSYRYGTVVHRRRSSRERCSGEGGGGSRRRWLVRLRSEQISAFAFAGSARSSYFVCDVVGGSLLAASSVSRDDTNQPKLLHHS